MQIYGQSAIDKPKRLKYSSRAFFFYSYTFAPFVIIPNSDLRYKKVMTSTVPVPEDNRVLSASQGDSPVEQSRESAEAHITIRALAEKSGKSIDEIIENLRKLMLR